MNCPNCGANMRLSDGKAVCEYCGYEEPLPADPGQSDAFFNLIVNNESVNPVDILVSVPDCDVGFSIRQGEAVAKDVPAGYHTIVVSAEGKTEYRSILVPGDGKAVKVYVAMAALGISIRVVEPGSSGYGGRGYSYNRLPNSVMMPVMALVFSIILPVVGLILAIVDTVMSKNSKRKLSPITIVAYVMVGARFLIMITLLIIGVFLNR